MHQNYESINQSWIFGLKDFRKLDARAQDDVASMLESICPRITPI